MPTKPTYKEDFEFTCNRVRDEDRLIGDRFSWLLTSQTIFLGAYAFVLTQTDIPEKAQSAFKLIPPVTFLVCLINYLSILGAVWAIYLFCKALDKDHPEHSKNSQWHILGPTRTHIMGQAAPIFIPLAFLAFWIYFLGMQSPILIVIIVVVILLLILGWILLFPYRRT